MAAEPKLKKRIVAILGASYQTRTVGPDGKLRDEMADASTSQIKPSVLRVLRGRQGPQGPPGPLGPQGAQGRAGTPANEAQVHRLEAELAEVKGGVNGLCKGLFQARLNALIESKGLSGAWDDIEKTLDIIEKEVPHACVF